MILLPWPPGCLHYSCAPGPPMQYHFFKEVKKWCKVSLISESIPILSRRRFSSSRSRVLCLLLFLILLCPFLMYLLNHRTYLIWAIGSYNLLYVFIIFFIDSLFRLFQINAVIAYLICFARLILLIYCLEVPICHSRDQYFTFLLLKNSLVYGHAIISVSISWTGGHFAVCWF